MTALPMQMRYEINNVVQRLAADGDTFEPQDAADLIRLVPVTPYKWWGGGIDWTLPGGSSTGTAAGIGDVSIRNEDRKGYVGTAPGGHRVGGYRIEHNPGRVLVALMWADTKDEDGQKFILNYDPKTNRATRMEIAYMAGFKIGLLLTKWERWRRWKTPA